MTRTLSVTALFSRRGMIAAAILVSLLGPGSLAGSTAVRAWQTIYAIPDPNRLAPMSSRQLADGSTMLVVSDSGGFSALRYDDNGVLLSAASFDAPFVVRKAEIGPFGEIAMAAVTSSCSCGSGGNLWVMKFDGFTGRGLWSAPAVYGSDAYDGNTVLNFLLDSAGDVVAEVEDYSANVAVLKYDGRTGAPKFAPILFTTGLMGDIKADAAGNLIVATTTLDANHDFQTTKYDGQTGAVLWGPISYDSGFDQDYALLVADDETGVVVVGYSLQADGYGLTLLKYDAATGATVWGPTRYLDPSGALPDATGLRIEASGDVVVSASVSPGGPNVTDFLLKFSGASGSLLWGPQIVKTAANSFFPIHLTLTGNGDIVTDAPESNDGTNYYVVLRRFRHDDGTLAWGPTSDGPGGGETVTLTSQGRLFLAYGYAGPNSTFVTARAANTGATVWTAPNPQGNAHGYTLGTALCALPSGDVVVLGEGYPALDDFILSRYAQADGTTVWGPVSYGALNQDIVPVQVLADSLGDVIVLAARFTGRTNILKYSGASGSLIWGPIEFIDAPPVRMALDASGNVAVVMKSDIGSQFDFGTVLVSGASGAVLWGPVTYDGGANRNDLVDDVAVLPSGDVVVAGRADAGTGPRAAVLAYSGSSGSLLWGPVIEPTIVNPGMRLAASASGDVFLTGGLLAISTLKLSGSTGSVLWGPVTVANGTGSDQEGLALAVDAAGNVIVAGALDATFPGTEFATLKYAGSDGTLLWGPVTYQGSLDGRDAPTSASIDGDGNALVSGTARNALGLRDVVTLKYDGPTGNLLWGPVTTFTGADQDFGGLAVSGGVTFVGTSAPAGMVTTAYTEGLGILTQPSDLPVGACGQAYTAAFEAANGTPPYTWDLASGTPPTGVAMSPDGSLSGVPVEEGTFPLRVEVHDSSANSAVDLDVTIRVADAAGIAPIIVTPSTSDACAWTLSVGGSFTSIQWLPGGESTPTIDVEPAEPTTYGAILTDAQGCLVHAAVVVAAPRCSGPTLLAITPRSGSSAGSSAVTLTGTGFDPAATFTIGGAAASSISVVSDSEITGLTPALPAGVLYDVAVTNSNAVVSTLPQSFFTDYSDVPGTNPFHDDVVKITFAGITAGCGGGNYCPTAPVTRAQMAVFLLKAALGSSYMPPPATGTIFQDVPAGAFAADWIEDLFARGITGGCSLSPPLYCPDQAVTRAQMAVFLLKAEHGSSYAPPACAGIFNDVPCPGGFAVDWIEQLHAEGITAGCGGGDYCPAQANTRGQMAVFLVRTFGIP